MAGYYSHTDNENEKDCKENSDAYREKTKKGERNQGSNPEETERG